MRNLVKFSFVLVTCAFIAIGCAPADNHADHDHDHGDEAHDHGDDHAGHHHEAPHGGALIPLGDHVGHGELLIDEAGKVTLYLLDGEAEAPIRVAQETITIELTPEGGEAITIELSAVENVLTSETVGDTSQFEGTEAGLAGVEHADGTIVSIDFRGMTFENVAFHYPEGE